MLKHVLCFVQARNKTLKKPNKLIEGIKGEKSLCFYNYFCFSSSELSNIM